MQLKEIEKIYKDVWMEHPYSSVPVIVDFGEALLAEFFSNLTVCDAEIILK